MAPVGQSPLPTSTSASSAASTSSSSNSSSHGGSLDLSSSSHPIAKKQQKKQPIIRVVHVYAPTLIKTDPANFRSLVQKLTGNKGATSEESAIKSDMHHEYNSANYLNEHDYHSDYLNPAANYEKSRVLESSKQAKKKINRFRKSAHLGAFNGATNERKGLQFAESREEDPVLQNGFNLLEISNCSRLARINEDDYTGLATSIDDSELGGANLASYFELARSADDIIDGYFACEDAYTDWVYQLSKL
ncbi:hypothetical protein L7F22_024804 [Adiantum nelumboides]|nr:hypothetical protein [Adiantum nelumboides]